MPFHRVGDHATMLATAHENYESQGKLSREWRNRMTSGG